MNFRKSAKISALICSIAFTISIFSGCGLFPQEEETLAPPLVAPTRTEYELYTVQKGSIADLVEGSGVFTFENAIDSYFTKSGGMIKSIDVKVGDKVTKGQVVARLEAGNLESQIKISENNLNKGKLYLDNLVKYKAADYDIKMAQLDVDNQQIQLDDLKKQLSSCILTSQTSGTVTFTAALKPGDTVKAYSTIVTVSDPSKLLITFTSDDASKVKTGMKAMLRYNSNDYQGKVIFAPDSIPKNASPEERTSKENLILIQMNSMPEGAANGDSLEVSIAVQSKDNTIVIPSAALKEVFDRKYVLVLDKDSKKEVNVKVGIQTPSQVEILSGLEEGQKVILK